MTYSYQFPQKLDVIKENLISQEEILRKVAALYADAIEVGGLVHVYANGHSRVTVEETVVRMGALTGFHPLISLGLTTFNNVIGTNGIRICQAFEFTEGLGNKTLDEFHIGPKDVLVVITATGTTSAAVDMALAWSKRYPDNPLVGICCAEQSEKAKPKHSSGLNLTTVIKQTKHGYIINNGMPMGDLSIDVHGMTGDYQLCPLSSIGALSITQSLNELTLKVLDGRGVKPMILQNMHLGGYGVNYDEWIMDQRARYAQTIFNLKNKEVDHVK
ncbi:SIS domain-containing protein [Aeromonas jandaei]